ncbi:unnamed protein product [Zymoseptoria tritici ST99CH_3D1]|nr:unnamed protein product [Zymoseptoria tritici ST99CH_3D1]
MAERDKTMTLINWPNHSCPSPDQHIRIHFSPVISPVDDSGYPSRHELYHLAFLLRQKLVPDLVPLIFRAAGLFSRSTITKCQTRRIGPAHSCVYLVTPQIYSTVRVQSPVVKVRFTIIANDWGLDRSIGQSGFSAGVIRGGLSPLREEWDEVKRFAEHALVHERLVVVNTPGSDDLEKHVVEWKTDSEDAEEAAWVRALAVGDRIAVKAWARWASFENLVSSVEISVYTAAIVR